VIDPNKVTLPVLDGRPEIDFPLVQGKSSGEKDEIGPGFTSSNP
jgi:hypothetical protein